MCSSLQLSLQQLHQQQQTPLHRLLLQLAKSSTVPLQSRTLLQQPSLQLLQCHLIRKHHCQQQRQLLQMCGMLMPQW